MDSSLAIHFQLVDQVVNHARTQDQGDRSQSVLLVALQAVIQAIVAVHHPWPGPP